MTLTSADVVTPVARYARRFHAVAGSRHHVGSPLGAWLLLALCAPPSEGKNREILNGILGCDVADAAGLAAGLLARPDPQVPAAAAVWHRPGRLTDVVTRWLAGLPPQVQTGPLTSQADLDDWARRGTLGLIERFPVALDPSLYLLAATVLAARVSWERPFDLAPASALGPSSPWAGTLSQVLRTPDGPGHQQFVAATQAAGDVAVHAARARGGLQVISVAAAPGVPAADVLAAAYDLGPALAHRRPGDAAVAVRPAAGRGAAVGDHRADRAGQVRFRPRGAVHGRAAGLVGAQPARPERSQPRVRRGRGGPGARRPVAGPAGGDGPVQPGRLRGRRGDGPGRRHGRQAVPPGPDPDRGTAVRAPVRGGRGRRRRPAGPGPWHGLPVFSAWVAQPEDAARAAD